MKKIVLSEKKNEIQELMSALQKYESEFVTPILSKHFNNKLKTIKYEIESKTNDINKILADQINSVEKEIEGKLYDFNTIYEDGQVLKAGIPHVIMREKTIRTIFEEFYEFSKTNHTNKTINTLLFNTGRKNGNSFAIDLLSILRKYNVFVEKIQDFIDILWSEFDAHGGYGKINLVKMTSKKITLSIKNNFLVSSNNSHKFCAWMKGYVYGVLELIFIELPYMNHILHKTRNTHDDIYQLDNISDHCDAEVENNECLYVIDLVRIKGLNPFYDKFFNIKYQNYKELSNLQSMYSIRGLFDCINESIRGITDNKIKLYCDLSEDKDELDHLIKKLREVLSEEYIYKSIDELIQMRDQIKNGDDNISPDHLNNVIISFTGYLLNIHRIIIENKQDTFIDNFDNRMMFKK
jgi:hypothetical protein